MAGAAGHRAFGMAALLYSLSHHNYIETSPPTPLPASQSPPTTTHLSLYLVFSLPPQPHTIHLYTVTFSMLEPATATDNYNLSMYSLMLQGNPLVIGSLFKKLKHDSVIIGC